MIQVMCALCSKTKLVYPCQTKVRDLFFCNKSCHRTYKNNLANPSWTRDLSGVNNPMYGKENHSLREWNSKHKGEDSPNWKGGVHTRSDGYVRISVNGKRELLHRHLLADILSEANVVHHKDGNPSNNKLNNLEILPSQSEHARLHLLERHKKYDTA